MEQKYGIFKIEYSSMDESRAVAAVAAEFRSDARSLLEKALKAEGDLLTDVISMKRTKYHYSKPFVFNLGRTDRSDCALEGFIPDNAPASVLYD